MPSSCGLGGMQSRGKVIMILALLMIALLFGGMFFFQQYSVIKDDVSGNLGLAPRNYVVSTFKEGYLVPVQSPTKSDFFMFRLYENPTTRSGFFEIWSDRDQASLTSVTQSGKIDGKKVRLELESRKLETLRPDVWYIRPTSGD